MKKLIIVLMVMLSLTACGGASVEKDNAKEEKVTKEEKIDYEEIAKKALENEHEHVWEFTGFSERHPHEATYKCSCGATKLTNETIADFDMKGIDFSEEHPHYLLRECSICKQQFIDESIKKEIKWFLDGYEKEHPHYAIIKCSECDYTKVEKNIPTKMKLLVVGYEKEHPHKAIIKCNKCDYSYVEQNGTAFDTGVCKLEVDKDNYDVAHPHFLFERCTYEGCLYDKKTNTMADWTWDDGVCSICGGAKDVLYNIENNKAIITGIINNNSEKIIIPNIIEGYPVKIIRNNAFQDSSIKAIKIPDSVVLIEEFAFENCSNLGKLEIGNSIQEIRDLAFENCKLNEIRINSSVAPIIGFNSFGMNAEEIVIYIHINSVGYDLVEWERYHIEYFDE